MSAIEKELVKATGIESKKGETRQEYLFRLAKATASLNDKEWEGLSADAQNWYNENTDARNKAKKAEKDLPDFKDFPDAKKEEEEEQPRRRRNVEEDEADTKKKGGKATGGPDLLKEDLVCEIETKRGKVFAGKVLEIDEKKGFVVVKTKDDEIEIDLDKIATVSHDAVEEEATSRRSSKKDDGDEPDPIKKGAKVKVTTKRGKELEGTIVEITKDDLVLKTDDGEEDLRRDRIETIKLLGGAKKDDDEVKPRGKKEDEAGDKQARSKNKEGVSIGQRIREIIADAKCDITVEGVSKKLKAEDIEFKENTLTLNYSEVMKTVAVLKEAKLLKV